MHYFLSAEVQALRDEAQAIAAEVILPAAEQVDAQAAWPEAGMRTLASARLTALTAPQRVGGHGMGLLALATITEVLGRACASTGMCFGMHAGATAVIAAKATPHHDERYLRPIAQGQHLTTLALSEGGTGAHFFLPQTPLQREGDTYVVHGTKQFVTNGSQADSYVVSTLASTPSDLGDFSCLVVDRDTPGVGWSAPWAGFGMRGNSSRAMSLDGVRVPAANLLGHEGDQVWFVFEVVAPFFLTAMAGVYVGLAQSALDAAIDHLKTRRYAHSGESLADVELLQHRVGQLWMAVERSRLLLYHAARLGDLGSPDALTAILAAKADAAHTAVDTANNAMTLCGGSAYRENGVLARLLRDARASHVMAPTTDMLTTWTGRSALGRSLF